MSEEFIGPYHSDKCHICNAPDAAYLIPDESGTPRPTCWKHAKPKEDAPKQIRNPVGTRLIVPKEEK